MIRIITALLLCCPIVLFAQTWGQVASMPTGKHHPVSFALNGKGYAVTGTNSLDQPTNDVYQYDPSTNQWTEMAEFPGGVRSFAIGQTYNGKGYLGFGASLTSYFNDIWEYDPALDAWTLLTTCDCSGRRHPAFIIRDEKIYVGLGDDSSGDLNDWHVYDMSTDTWSTADNMPGPIRHHPFMFPAGDHVYVGMGHGGAFVYDDWYKFNINTETWETMADFPGESRVAGTQFGHQGKGYVLSGDGSNHSWMPTGEFWEYDPVSDNWTELDPHPGISRWAPGSFVINGAVYFLGGENRQTETILNDMWTYQLSIPSSTSGDLEAVNEFEVYPNPAEDVVFIKSDMSIQRLRVVSLSGSLLVESTTTNKLDLSSLSAGIYFLEAELEDETMSVEKIVVR